MFLDMSSIFGDCLSFFLKFLYYTFFCASISSFLGISQFLSSSMDVPYFCNCDSCNCNVFENNSLTRAFRNGISSIFLIDGLLFGSLISNSDMSFFRSLL